MNDQIVTLEEQAVQAVREAGALLADPAAVRSIRAKSKTDYVTNVDVAVQEFLRERLAALAPDIQFMGEEQDNRPLDWSRPCWILDPVDGTTNLIHRFRHSAVSLALAEGGQIRLGVVYNPYSGECFTARRGLGAFCNGSPIRVSGTDRLGDSLLSVGTVPGCRELADTAFRQMRDLYDACQDIRRTGALPPALGLCRRASAGGGGRRAGHRPGRKPPLPVSGRAPAGHQRQAAHRHAISLEVRTPIWTCAFPPRPGS